MVNKNYFEAFKTAIVRIYHANGAVVGAGFLVSDRYLLTCAHVVAAALSIPQNTQEMPTGSIELDFPLMAGGQKVKAKVVFWLPVNSSLSGEDIAGLEIEGSLPANIEPIRLQTTEDHRNHNIEILGFPKERDCGIWATGTLRDRIGNGRIQIDAMLNDRPVEAGFSGTPVWDESLKGVVGMVVAAEKWGKNIKEEEKRRENVISAFMIPTQILTEVWSVLNQPIGEVKNPKRKSSRFTQLKIQSLKDNFEKLEKDYKDVDEKRKRESNPQEKNNLELQLQQIGKEMEKIERDIDELEDGDE